MLLVPGFLIASPKKLQSVSFTPILQQSFGVTCVKYFSKRMALVSSQLKKEFMEPLPRCTYCESIFHKS